MSEPQIIYVYNPEPYDLGKPLPKCPVCGDPTYEEGAACSPRCVDERNVADLRRGLVARSELIRAAMIAGAIVGVLLFLSYCAFSSVFA